MAVTGIAGGAGQTAQAVHNLNSDSNATAAQNAAPNNRLRSTRTLTNQTGRNATAEERGPGEAQEGSGAEAREANGAQAQQAQTTAQAGARLNLFA